MKNYLFIWTSCLVLCLVGWSCSLQELESDSAQNAVILTVSCTQPNTSRAETMQGVPAYKENLITTLDYFFYPKGGTAENAVLSERITLANGGTQNGETVRITIDEEDLAALFPQSQDQCEVFVVANLPKDKIPDDTSLENLKKVSITTNFDDSKKPYPWLQDSFIMVGEGTATVIDRNLTVVASANILLERLAAKLTIRIQIEDSVTDGGKVWTPQKNSLKLVLRNAARTTTLSGEPNDVTPFDFAERINPSQEGNFYVFAPFYSYPRSWDIINSDALAFYIELIWYDGTKYEPCYYKVMPNTSQLNPNNWYHMDLTIGVMGTTTQEEEPVSISDVTYKVVDWANGNDYWYDSGLQMGTELLEAHYLVVEKNVYEVDNQNTFEIPFITSHTCEISWKVERWNFFGENNNFIAKKETLSQNSTNSQWITLDAITNTIKLNHELINFNDNSTDENYDYATYIYTVTLKHKNDDRFTEEITIHQSPALVIEPYLNSGYKSNMQSDYGFYFVNGCNKSSNDTDNANNTAYNYGGASGPQDYHTKNPSMYVVETTVLPADSKYILGDPRDFNFSFTNNDMKEFVRALPIGAVEGREAKPERTLSQTNYHPTLSDASVQEMISPKFRIASSYGVCTSAVSYADARKRCATYQEDGYPAGRWRIPTKAEVQFMIRLSKDTKIPQLFNTTYWCANGTVNDQGTFTATTTSSGTYVRCVYDEWYWENSQWPRMASRGNHPNKYNQFTWGDEIN